MISIEIKRATEIPGIYSCYMSFSEYNRNWIEVIRQFSTRKYNNETKTWEFPLHNLKDIIQRYQNVEIEITYNKEKELEQLTALIPELNLKRPLFEHQKVAVEYGLTHPKYLLLDTVGLGKTSSVIAEAIALKKLGKIKQCLIVCCVSDLQYNWAKEIETVCDESYFILGTRYRKDGTPFTGSVNDRVDDICSHKEFFLITNKETFLNEKFISILRGDYKTKKCLADMIAIDECHKIANPTSIVGKNILKLKNRFSYVVPMTGTLLRNKPTDAWLPLTLIDSEHSNFSTFKNYYCEYGTFNQITSYKNLEYLQKQISDCSLRRTKEEVMDLPEKIYQNVYVTMNKRQQLIYNEAYNWALANIDLISNSPNPLAQLIRLRQATGYTGILSSSVKESAKIDRIVEDVDEIIENNKVIVYSNWTDMTDELYNRLSEKYGNVLRITGKDVRNGRETEEIKKKFMEDPNYRILVGTTGKLGTGHTLTSANWVLFLDEPWTMAEKEQAVGRIDRSGQTKTMQIRTYITKDTMDERVNMIVENKGALADYIVDKKSRVNLVKFLLNQGD